MKIGIMGTRGIPNRYGGFEQFAQQLSVALVQRGHDVWVYNSSLHDYQDSKWNGVNMIHCRDKEDSLGTVGQFFYDLNCLKDARHREFEVLLHLGYTSDSIWHRRWPKHCLNVVNMDGLEWKRAKYNWLTRQFLKKAEKWAARNANVIIADNPAIKSYLGKKYHLTVHWIPYPVERVDESTISELSLAGYGLQPGNYCLLIARMEPENNIEMIIRGYLQAGVNFPLVIVGNVFNKHGKKLVRKYASDAVRFIGAVYEKPVLDALRYYSSIYFHGHSVGGTNPSLLEAMACSCHIAAHGNDFNRAVLGVRGEYFLDANDVSSVLQKRVFEKVEFELGEYELNKIVEAYESLFVNGTRIN